MAVGDIAIAGDRIVGTYETYPGATEIDGRGLIAVPGFIDSHVHCEIDPGAAAGVRPLRRAARHDDGDLRSARDLQRAGRPRAAVSSSKCAEVTVMDLRVQLSSCVPATHLETSGARLEADDLLPFKTIPRCSGWPR